MRFPRSSFGKLSIIAIASAIGSAAVTIILNTIQMAEKKPASSAKNTGGAAGNNEEEDGGEGSKKPSGGGGGEKGKKGIYNTVADFVRVLKEQLPDVSIPKPPPVLDSFSLGGVVRYIREGKAKNIVVMAGAGISTSAGIPDFRSPGSGLYDNLAEYNLPHPQAIFDIGYFKENPIPFFKLAKELFPGKLKPTPCHYFIRLLHEKGMLLRAYTQNIDALEHVAGVPADKVVEGHGTFRTSHCTMCADEYDLKWMRDKIMSLGKDAVPRCETCEGVVKPDVVFFGEALPSRFFTMVPQDLGGDCDLLIIVGTSLTVHPFASLIDRVGSKVPRLLINKEKVGKGDALTSMLGIGGGLLYDDEAHNYRDAYWAGTCDDGCLTMAEMLGWKDELNDMIQREWAKIDASPDGAVLPPNITTKSSNLQHKDAPSTKSSGSSGK